MTNEQKETQIKTLMKTVIEAMDELNKLSPDYWRILITAFYEEMSSGATEKITKLKCVDDIIDPTMMNYPDTPKDVWSSQERLLMFVYDAIVDTTQGGKPYDQLAVRTWFGYPKDVREILKDMPEDVFSAVFDKMAQNIIAQNEAES